MLPPAYGSWENLQTVFWFLTRRRQHRIPKDYHWKGFLLRYRRINPPIISQWHLRHSINDFDDGHMSHHNLIATIICVHCTFQFHFEKWRRFISSWRWKSQSIMQSWSFILCRRTTYLFHWISLHQIALALQITLIFYISIIYLIFVIVRRKCYNSFFLLGLRLLRMPPCMEFLWMSDFSGGGLMRRNKAYRRIYYLSQS